MSIYAEPRTIDSIEDCYFYHTMDLPDVGTINGNWDLRKGLNIYLGNIRFSEKRVLDVGCANGILSFYMESQGAEVVSYDLDSTGDWDMVPFAKWEEYQHIANDRKSIIDRLNNAYWYSHARLKSQARVVYGSVYSVPESIGPVDISVYGSILLHIRDPFAALHSGIRLTRETVIVTEVLRGQEIQTGTPSLVFLPDSKTVEPKDTWWDIRPEWVVRAIGVLGFEDTQTLYHSQIYEGRSIELYTVVGRRTHGRPIE